MIYLDGLIVNLLLITLAVAVWFFIKQFDKHISPRLEPIFRNAGKIMSRIKINMYKSELKFYIRLFVVAAIVMVFMLMFFRYEYKNESFGIIKIDKITGKATISEAHWGN